MSDFLLALADDWDRTPPTTERRGEWVGRGEMSDKAPLKNEWDECVAYVENVIERPLTNPERALLAHGFSYGQRAGRKEASERAALLEAADRVVSRFERQISGIHAVAHSGAFASCEKERCKTTTEAIDAYRRARGAGEG